MTDLTNKCLFDKEEVRYIHKALLNSKMTFASGANPDIASKLTKQALNQDLNGMVLVPVEATDDMIDIAFEYHSFNDEDEVSELFKLMLEAAPKLGE
jgi:hypothetical protein